MDEAKGELKIQLYIGENLAFESKDPALWQRVFLLMSDKSITKDGDRGESGRRENGSSSEPLARFAAKLEISTAEAEGGLSPEKTGTYLTLDHRYYEAFRKNFPPKGKNSMNATKLIATGLCVWFQEAQLGEVRVKHIEDVLGVLGVEDKNIYRTVDNADWLRIKSGVISVNPAEISKAYELLRLFCTKRPPGG